HAVRGHPVIEPLDRRGRLPARRDRFTLQCTGRRMLARTPDARRVRFLKNCAMLGAVVRHDRPTHAPWRPPDFGAGKPASNTDRPKNLLLARRRRAPRAAEDGGPMETRILGRTGRPVSVIGLGTWQLGADWGDVDPADARAVLETSLEAGVTFYDT